MYIGITRAACYAFQKPSSPDDEGNQAALSSTAVVKYVGIEKRDGLVGIGKQLLEGGSIFSPQISAYESVQVFYMTAWMYLGKERFTPTIRRRFMTEAAPSQSQLSSCRHCTHRSSERH